MLRSLSAFPIAETELNPIAALAVIIGLSNNTTNGYTLSTLEPRTGREIIDLFQQLRDGGRRVFLVTHDAAVAVRADRIVQVQDGRVLDSVESDRCRVPWPTDRTHPRSAVKR
jgi:hypothetical protein